MHASPKRHVTAVALRRQAQRSRCDALASDKATDATMCRRCCCLSLPPGACSVPFLSQQGWQCVQVFEGHSHYVMQVRAAVSRAVLLAGKGRDG